MQKTASIWSTLPGVLVLLALAFGLSGSFRSDNGWSTTDDTLKDAHIAGLTSGKAGASEVAPKPPSTRDVLWRLILKGVGTGEAARYVLLAASVLVVVLAGRLAALAGADAIGSAAASLAVALASPFYLDPLHASPVTLTVLLVVSALVLHLRSARPLSLPAAALIGLAMWQRVEVLLVWLLLWLGAIIETAIRRRGLVWSLVQGINGLLLIALLMAPLIAWNLRAVGVPWPRFPDALLAVDAFAQVPADEIKARLAEGMAGTAAWLRSSWLRTSLVVPHFLLVLPLVAVAIYGGVRRRALRNILALVVVLVGTPVLIRILIPFTGTTSVRTLLVALTPVAAALMGRGITAAVDSLGPVFNARAGWVVKVALAAISVLLCVPTAWQAVTEDRVQRETDQTQQARVLDEVRAAGVTRVMTDRAGMFLAAGGFEVIDLRGEWTPIALAAMDAMGRWSGGALMKQLDGDVVSALVLWQPRYAEVASAIGAGETADTMAYPQVIPLQPDASP